MATGTVQLAIFMARVGRKAPQRILLDTGRYEVRFDFANHFFGILDGKPAETTQWLTAVCYDRLGDFAEKYLKTGSLVYISGQIHLIYQGVEILVRDLQVFGPCLICSGKPVHCETCSCPGKEERCSETSTTAA